MKVETKNYLEAKRNAWLRKEQKIADGDERTIGQRMLEMKNDIFAGDPTSYRLCVACGDYDDGGWTYYEDDGDAFHICAHCGAIQQMIGTQGDVPAI